MKRCPMLLFLKVLSMVLLIAAASCPGPEPILPPDGGDESEGQDCGSRTVSTLPGPGYLRVNMEFLDRSIQPPDSDLGKVIWPTLMCGTMQGFDTNDLILLYELDAQNVVTATIVLMEVAGQKYYMRTAPEIDQWLEIEDGCLKLTIDDPEGSDVPLLSPDDLPAGPCDPGQLAITRDGPVFTEQVEGDYTCIAIEDQDSCHDCWQENDTWVEELRGSGAYVALGSLDQVSVATYSQICGGDVEAVNIVEGDRMEFDFTMRTTYELSLSPEELGYQEWSSPDLN